jgi:hypothetical protein
MRQEHHLQFQPISLDVVEQLLLFMRMVATRVDHHTLLAFVGKDVGVFAKEFGEESEALDRQHADGI